MRLETAGAPLSRRLIISAASLLCASPQLPAFAAKGLSSIAIDTKLSRVPIFVVTNGQAAPYLTEMDDAGRRSGFFFLSPQEAATALQDVKAYDPRASLNVVPLDNVWRDLSKSVSEVAGAPQPTAGTSTDMRLFRLQPLPEEQENVQKLRSRPDEATAQELRDGGVPLFYEPTLRLNVDMRAQTPYFFRLGDLGAAYDQEKAAASPMNQQLADVPTPKVISLAALLKKLEDGTADADTVLVAASEAAAVVARMSGVDRSGGVEEGGETDALGRPLVGGASGGAAAPKRDELEFWLKVPFASGKV